jgi:hypothetical protein
MKCPFKPIVETTPMLISTSVGSVRVENSTVATTEFGECIENKCRAWYKGKYDKGYCSLCKKV